MITIYNFVNFLLVSIIFVTINGRDEPKWKCADPKCEVPISEGTSRGAYSRKNNGEVSVKKDEKFYVLRKSHDPPGKFWIKLKSNGKEMEIPEKITHIDKVVRNDNQLIDHQTITQITPSKSSEVYDGTTVVEDYNNKGRSGYPQPTPTVVTSRDSTATADQLASTTEPPSMSSIESMGEMSTSYQASEGSFNSSGPFLSDSKESSTATLLNVGSESVSSNRKVNDIINSLSPTSSFKSTEVGKNTSEFNSTGQNSQAYSNALEYEKSNDNEPKSSESEETLARTSSDTSVHKKEKDKSKENQEIINAESASENSNASNFASNEKSSDDEITNSTATVDSPPASSESPPQEENDKSKQNQEINNAETVSESSNAFNFASNEKPSNDEITNSTATVDSPPASSESPPQEEKDKLKQNQEINNAETVSESSNASNFASNEKSSDDESTTSLPAFSKSPHQEEKKKSKQNQEISNAETVSSSSDNLHIRYSDKEHNNESTDYVVSKGDSFRESSSSSSPRNSQSSEFPPKEETNDTEIASQSSHVSDIISSEKSSDNEVTNSASAVSNLGFSSLSPPQFEQTGVFGRKQEKDESETVSINSNVSVISSSDNEATNSKILEEDRLPQSTLKPTPDASYYSALHGGNLNPQQQLNTHLSGNLINDVEDNFSEIPTSQSTSNEKTSGFDENPISNVDQLLEDSEKMETSSTEYEKNQHVSGQVESEELSIPWYSSLVDTFQGVFSFENEEVIHESRDDHSQKCFADSCLSENHDKQLPAEDQYGEWLSLRSMTIIIITTVAVIIFSLGHYYLENLRRDTELISKYNDLSGKLFIEQTEKEMLAKQLIEAKESFNQISFDSTKNNQEIEQVKAQLKFYKDECATIKEKEKETSKKFVMVDKNYNELRKILSQTKQKGERSALIADIKTLKDSIEANNIEIASLKEQLLEKKEEIKGLNNQIIESRLCKEHLEKSLEETISDGHKQVQQFQESIAKLEKIIEENVASHVKLEEECTQLKKEKESLTLEKELVESSLQKFQRLQPAHSLKEWLNAKDVRVSLLGAEKKLQEMLNENNSLLSEKSQLEDKLGMLTGDLKQLDEKYETAEKEKIDALTKLQVLSDYFKEKETQLQEELGSKEAIWLQKQSDDRTIYEQMRALREENASFKNQNETMKREVLEQEASFKKLITSAEEKAHENWVALRHHERRLKEAHMEAAQLRSRLTALEATGDNGEDKIGKDEVNGDIPPFGSATSPPFMLYSEFMPPPPLVSATASRPPPLGRISSPPLDDFTPPPPLVPYEMFLPPSPPPPHQHGLSHVVHKPQPLDRNHRVQKDSQSSNHSSESAPDKPRRNKR